MKVSDLMQAMSDAGAPMEAILIAVRAIEERDDALTAKRAIERDRKRRQRAKDDDSHGTVTGQSRDIGGTVTTTTPLSLPLSPQTPQTPTHTPGDNTRARKGGLPAKPEGVSDQTWADFTELRKGKRAPLSESALAGIKREATKAGWSMEAALAKCLARGWQGFEADWVSAEPKPQAAGEADPLMRSILARRSQEAPP